MNDLSRRSFLGKSSLAAAAAAGAVAVPSLLRGDTAQAESSAPDGLSGAAGLGAGDGDGDGTDVILHIPDTAGGEISAFVGERQIVFTDRAFVTRVNKLTA
jgi:hypothetical protein